MADMVWQNTAPNIRNLERNFKAALKRLPRIIGNEGKNFFLDSFTRQGWQGASFERWPARKASKWGKKGRGRKGRAILIQTGRLRRSIRVISQTTDLIGWGSNVPYARAHNEGLRLGLIQNVKSYTRMQRMAGVASRFGKGRQYEMGGSMSLKTRRAIKPKPVITQVTVKAHKRHIDQRIPRRQFMGNSPYLVTRLKRVCSAEIMRAMKGG